MKENPLDARSSGVLLHLTSLPGPHGNGDLGPAAREVAEWMARAGQRWWQMLPVGPVGAGFSPYDARSSFAGEPMLVSLEELAKEGLLDAADLEAPRALAGRKSLFAESRAFRMPRLRKAFERFELRGARARKQLDSFAAKHEWLADYVLFTALEARFHAASWSEWPAELRDRKPAALERARQELAEELRFHTFLQLQFDRQWQQLRTFCAGLKLQLIGDLPQFVGHQCAEVWARPELFHLDKQGCRKVVAGVPPDAFSETGQLWGNPLYRWPRMQAEGYRWWIERLRAVLSRFDVVRLDHFIGFTRYWEVDAAAPTAEHGRFVRVPGEDFLATVQRELGLPFIAEDLGVLTDRVHALRDEFRLPGMRILQFAFGGSEGDRAYQPHRYPPLSVAYTGTHDNETLVGWLRSEDPATAASAQRALRYAGGPTDPTKKDAHWSILRLLAMSPANIVIVPLQDLLGQDAKSRMNIPGTAEGNWDYRVLPKELDLAVSERWGELCELYERRVR